MLQSETIRKYDAYKDSGIEWIGDIPQNWELLRLQFCLDEIKQKNNPIQSEQVLSLVKDRGVMLYEEKGNVGNVAKEDISEYKLAYPNTLILNSMNILIGSVGISNYFGCVSPVYYVFKETDKSDLRFINYIFTTREFQKELRRYANGIMEIRLRVSAQDIFKRKIAFPNKQEQIKIADYLDKKCGEIDRVIETEKSVIEKLKEYKQSIITEAVTKGLDKSIPLKDSGIEWIGKIPQHWEIRKLHSLFNFIGGFAFKSDDYVDETENQVIRIGNIRNNNLILDDKKIFITNTIADDALSVMIKCNDILFSMTGTKGKRDYFYTLVVKKEYLQNKNLYLNQRVGCFRKKIDLDERYFNYLLKETRILDSIFIYETGTANQGNLGIETIRNTKLHFPTVIEQQQIADYLDKKCSEIDKAIADKEQVIEKFTEYKKSLIYECVTGKRKVV